MPARSSWQSVYVFDQWDDLFLSGGFAPRHVLLRSIDVKLAGARPEGAPHSIYQELWHATSVLRIFLEEGRMSLGNWPWEEHFPDDPSPSDDTEWQDLAASFLELSQRAVNMAKDEQWLDSFEPGFEDEGLRWRDGLEFLAIHTAYHLGKIVLLRQLQGAWPPAKLPAA